MSTIAYTDLLPAEIASGPAAQTEKKKNPPRPCRWRGWVDRKLIDGKLPAIQQKGCYIALFGNDVASSNSNRWQPFEMHTVKPMRPSEVARLLGHDFQSHGTKLKLTPFLRHEKFSDTNHAEKVVGERPDFDTRAFLVGERPDFDTRGPRSLRDRGLRSEIEEEDPDAFLINSHEEGNTGDENEEEDPGDERADSEASRLSTERQENGNQSPGPEATNTHVYNACNFLCYWTKTKPNARYISIPARLSIVCHLAALVKFIVSIYRDNTHYLYRASYDPASAPFVAAAGGFGDAFSPSVA